MKRLIGIGVIWLGCAIAWTILGATIMVRSGGADSSLTSLVYQLWGEPGIQQAPTGVLTESHLVQERKEWIDNGVKHVRLEDKTVETSVDATPDATTLKAAISLEQRKKGLMWFPTYGVRFESRYAFSNPTDLARTLTVTFPLERGGVLDDFEVLDAETGKPVPATVVAGSASWSRRLAPGESHGWTVHYATRGTESWTYQPSPRGEARVPGLDVLVTTDFPNVDFPAGSISPSRHGPTASGWEGHWTFKSLVTGELIGITLPNRLNPGPLASKITFFGPVALLFFFFVVAILGAAQGRSFHPLNYFFLGCAFFSFHLLMAYLVDHLEIVPSFLISAAVSIGLVISYARLFVGWKFALREMALSQLLYLVLFSMSFFWEGFTGLAVTIGAILTLFVMMQITGRLDWSAIEREKKLGSLSKA